MLPTICPVCKQATLEHDATYIYCSSKDTYRQKLSLLQRVTVWATGRQWWWRLLVMGWFGFVLYQNASNPAFATNRLGNIFSAIDMGIHELGHLLFIPLGQFMTIAGGSIFQCLFPMFWLAGLIQKRAFFAAAMCWCWLGINLYDVAAYVADARARLLPLATGLGGIGAEGDDAYDQAHDWYQLLSRTGHLQSDLSIAHGLRLAGAACFIIGFGLGFWLLYKIAASKSQSSA